MKNRFKIGALIASASFFGFALLASAHYIIPQLPPQLMQQGQGPMIGASMGATGSASMGQATVQGSQNPNPSQSASDTVVPGMVQQPMQQGQQMNGANASSSNQMQTRQGNGSQQQVIQIGPDGNALVRGSLVSVSGTTLVMTSWGMTFTVDTSNAQIVNQNVTSISSFNVGDFIGVSGTVSASAPGAITASIVRDRSMTNANTGSDVGGASISSSSSANMQQGQGGQLPPPPPPPAPQAGTSASASASSAAQGQ